MWRDHRPDVRLITQGTFHTEAIGHLNNECRAVCAIWRSASIGCGSDTADTPNAIIATITTHVGGQSEPIQQKNWQMATMMTMTTTTTTTAMMSSTTMTTMQCTLSKSLICGGRINWRTGKIVANRNTCGEQEQLWQSGTLIANRNTRGEQVHSRRTGKLMANRNNRGIRIHQTV